MFELGLLIVYANHPDASAALQRIVPKTGPARVLPGLVIVRLWKKLRLSERPGWYMRIIR